MEHYNTVHHYNLYKRHERFEMDKEREIRTRKKIEVKQYNDVLDQLAQKFGYKDRDDMFTKNDMYCPICYNYCCTNFTTCNHMICMCCMSKLKKCPICRAVL